MTEISNEVCHEIYRLSKMIGVDGFTESDAVRSISAKMKPSSAQMYIGCFKQMRKGNIYQRTINSYATEYFLEMIYMDYGKQGLRNALSSLLKHLDYNYKNKKTGLRPY